MPTLISHLNKTEQRELLNDLNYLNLREIRGFCKQHSIPYTIGIVIDSGESKEPRTPTENQLCRDAFRTGLLCAETCQRH